HELHQLCSRHYAFEGLCFVLAAVLMMHRRDIPAEFRTEAELAAASTNGSNVAVARSSRRIPVIWRSLCTIAKS
ncbi:MAG: hypothetical protein WCC92_14145, partial [Candidatus Korobacteraceae bacterium]